MSTRQPLAVRKVRFDDAQLPITQDGSPASVYNPARRWRRQSMARSLFRLALVTVVIVLVVTIVRQKISRTDNTDEETANAAAKDAVLGNCVYLEPLRHSHDCYEITSVKGKYHSSTSADSDSEHSPHQHDDLGIKTSFGAVLDHKLAYDTFTPASNSVAEDRFIRHWIVKCFVGFGMSIVWDFEFHMSLLQAYYRSSGRKPGSSQRDKDASAAATICPHSDAESSATMVLSINCDRDIERDKWGQPARDEDRETLETCKRMAYIWIRGRDGFQGIKPWANLCEVNADGSYGPCDQSTFQLEDRGIKPPSSNG